MTGTGLNSLLVDESGKQNNAKSIGIKSIEPIWRSSMEGLFFKAYNYIILPELDFSTGDLMISFWINI